jgi:hypothetical protein|tara:strand:+ start:2197 stop:3264 length:1068 start_codon:yes stop_codon:yes gene_type:complete
MRNLLCSLLLLGSLYSQDFFKFSTIYGAYSFSSPVTKEQQFQVTGGQLQELTQELDDHSVMTFGIRKLARFGYENKPEVWYTGTEAPINESVAIGNITGWEYVIEYSDHKEFEEEFIDQEYMIRYLGDKFLIKANYDYRGLEDLEFAALDMRYRKQFGNFSLSTGVAGRSHPAYLDFLPIDLWWAEQGIDTTDFTPFWDFAYFYGYTDEFVEQFTQYGYSYFDFKWYNAEGMLVANTDDQFYKQIYGEIVREYNEEWAKEQGYQNELSLSVGADYYKYNPKNWFHFWATAYPITKGYSDYSFNYDVAENGMDYDLGVVYGWKLTNKFGIFLEARYLNMYDIQSYEAKTGFNWLIY